MRCKKNILILVLLIALVLNSFGQNKGNTVALKSVLDAISQQHSVTFNYLENDLVPFKIIPPEKKLTLTEKLAYITENTQLQFLFVTKDYISVVKNKVEEKIICGYLKDFDTKEKLNNASIHYIGTTIYTISDENGYFELPLNTETSLEIDYLGYEKTILEASSLSNTKNCATLFLKVKSSQLNEIIATYFYLTKGIAQKSNGTFEIQPKKFGILPGLTEPDVLQTIQQLPGITSVDETITNINVRGGSHDQNLVLWNNIRLFQTGHFFGLISVFNPNLPSKVTITKNGSSAFYSESTSSVIDISTESNESNNSVGINMINVDFNTTLVKSNSTSLTVSGRRSFTDAIASPTYTNYYNRIFQNTVVTNLNNNENITYNSNENFYFYDFSAQWSQKITEKLNVVVNLISIYNQFDVFQSKEEKNILLDRSSYINQKTYGGTIFSTYNWNEKTKSELNVYGSYYKIDSKNEALEGNQIFKQENDILDTAIQLKNTHSITPNLTFTNGYQFNEIGVRNTDEINTPQFARKIKDVLQTHAVIVEAHHFTANQKLETTFGMRHNYITKFKKNLFEPRLQMNYSLSNSLNLLLLGEIKHQTSSQVIDLQQDFLGVEKRRWVLADNETIPIQISNQISLSATYKKNNWLLSLENFYKKVEGINSRSQGF